MKINVYMGIFQGILHFYFILTLSKVKNEGGKRKNLHCILQVLNSRSVAQETTEL